jgi:hypothetical protein
MAASLTAEDVSSGASPRSAPMSTSGAAWASVEPAAAAAIVRRYGEQFRARRRHAAPAIGQRNRLPCSELSVAFWILLELTFATPKLLNELA